LTKQSDAVLFAELVLHSLCDNEVNGVDAVHTVLRIFKQARDHGFGDRLDHLLGAYRGEGEEDEIPVVNYINALCDADEQARRDDPHSGIKAICEVTDKLADDQAREELRQIRLAQGSGEIE
jgi:hypothetical protein